jgi:3-isopropylmalate/(R)-2-methylmalate dehydratase small subunit
MEKFTILTGIAAPFPRVNVDTDTIIPKLYCKSVKRTGFGAHLFNDIRFFEEGSERPDFVLNRAPYRNASILITGENFGCGSSREAAAWALREFGIRCIVAPSFSDIFTNNCFQNAMLPLALPESAVDNLTGQAQDGANAVMTVDLGQGHITAPDGRRFGFEIDPYRKDCLLNGLDEIAVTMTHDTAIAAYETEIDAKRSWRRPARE